jgi:hypothetical protein
MSYDDLDDRFDADPQGVTDQVIAQAAARAAIHVSEIQEQRRTSQFEELVQGQIQSAGITAMDALEQKHGREAVLKYWLAVQTRLDQNPFHTSTLTQPMNRGS